MNRRRKRVSPYLTRLIRMSSFVVWPLRVFWPLKCMSYRIWGSLSLSLRQENKTVGHFHWILKNTAKTSSQRHCSPFEIVSIYTYTVHDMYVGMLILITLHHYYIIDNTLLELFIKYFHHWVHPMVARQYTYHWARILHMHRFISQSCTCVLLCYESSVTYCMCQHTYIYSFNMML